MGIRTVCTCDRCEKDIDLSGSAGEFCQAKAVLIEGEFFHSGFKAEGHHVGFSNNEFKMIVCKNCYGVIKAKIESALKIEMMDNKKSED